MNEQMNGSSGFRTEATVSLS